MKLSPCFNRSMISLTCVATLSGVAQAELRVPHIFGDDTGLVCAYDLGHIWMHSPYKAPLGERIVVQINGPIHPNSGGRAKILGFAVVGDDRHFYPAEAYMEGSDRVFVRSEFVKQPVAVRYAWGTRPYGTFVGVGWSGQPVAPFRTDNWEWRVSSIDRKSPEYREFDAWMREQREQAKQWILKRKVEKARKTLADLALH